MPSTLGRDMLKWQAGNGPDAPFCSLGLVIENRSERRLERDPGSGWCPCDPAVASSQKRLRTVVFYPW